jgi:hypothetical protein
MTYADLQTELFRRLEESQSDPDYWELPEILEALNDGWQDYGQHSLWYKTAVKFALQHNITYYDLRDFPDELVRIDRLWFENTEQWIEPTTVKLLEVKYRRWEAQDGSVPLRWFMRGAFQLGIWPKIQIGDSSHASPIVEMHARAIPPVLGPDDYTIPFPEEWQEGLLLYALYELKSQEGEVDAALRFWDQYVIKREGFTAWVRRQGDAAVWRGNREVSR